MTMHPVCQVIQDQLANLTDPEQIAKEILLNYQQYQYRTLENAYYHLLITFQHCFGISLDPERLVKACRADLSTLDRKYNYDYFGITVRNRDQRCRVTGYDSRQCEVAHIRPLHERYNFDPDNGLLLSSDLHHLFDQYWWSVNPDTGLVEVRPNHLKLSVNQFHNQPFYGDHLNQLTWKLLREHYQAFLECHHQFADHDQIVSDKK